MEVARSSYMARGHTLCNLNPHLPFHFAHHRWEVEVAGLSYMSRGHKLVPLFGLTFRRSSLQHPLLAGALGELLLLSIDCEHLLGLRHSVDEESGQWEWGLLVSNCGDCGHWVWEWGSGRVTVRYLVRG